MEVNVTNPAIVMHIEAPEKPEVARQTSKAVRRSMSNASAMRKKSAPRANNNTAPRDALLRSDSMARRPTNVFVLAGISVS